MRKERGHIGNANHLNIWYETFGKKNDPALLLIMGGLAQGILWPAEFCEKLASAGFYVIRFDHRDTGHSSSIDYEKDPYTLLDMAKDGVGLLDYLKIQKAHLFGLSMGGPIAELMAVNFSDRVLSLTIMATTSDFRPSSLSDDELSPAGISLSRPKKVYLDWLQRHMESSPRTFEEKLAERVECWHILNGFKVPFENELYRNLHREFLERMRNPESQFNHLSAIKNSLQMIRDVPHQVHVPTLIFHGSEDPIFPEDHGKALATAIKGSRYVFVEGMGHIPNRFFYEMMIDEIKRIAERK